ncbi:hypothetical protein C8J57DRAFT_1239113 [Mycena rebaudengoi]|nr:hypothetical protein C8J57DRAFT_1239113 [Mycena rebaudengoi]
MAAHPVAEGDAKGLAVMNCKDSIGNFQIPQGFVGTEAEAASSFKLEVLANAGVDGANQILAGCEIILTALAGASADLRFEIRVPLESDMHHPTSLYDERVYQEDPLLSLFYAHDLGECRTRHQSKKDNVTARIVSQLGSKECTAAVRSWLSFAFEADGAKTARINRANKRNKSLFVRFFWALYKGQDEEARLLLENERKSQGFVYALESASRQRKRRRSPSPQLKRRSRRPCKISIKQEDDGGLDRGVLKVESAPSSTLPQRRTKRLRVAPPSPVTKFDVDANRPAHIADSLDLPSTWEYALDPQMEDQMEDQQYQQLFRTPSPADTTLTDLSDFMILGKADFNLAPSADESAPSPTLPQRRTKRLRVASPSPATELDVDANHLAHIADSLDLPSTWEYALDPQMEDQMEDQQYQQLFRTPSPVDITLTDLSDFQILGKADFNLAPSTDENMPPTVEPLTSTTPEYPWPTSTGYSPIWAQIESQQYTQLTRPPSPSDTDLSDLLILGKADFSLTPSTDKNIPTSTTPEYEWPQSTGYPPIWAQSRQEVCETLLYFRTFHGGVYQKDGVVRGYLLGGFSSQRDLFTRGGKVIISHGGGGLEASQEKSNRGWKPVNQDASDISIRALLRNYAENIPVVLLIDDRYSKFPLDLRAKSIYIAVLALLAEYETVLGIQVGVPWWQAHSPSFFPPTSYPSPATSRTVRVCGQCYKGYPRVYEQGWACLNPKCVLFWRTSAGPLPDLVDYAESLFVDLKHPTFPLGFDACLEPGQPALALASQITTSASYTRGWHCRKCGRLSCRSAWEKYQCSHCQDVHLITAIVHPASRLQENYLVDYAGSFKMRQPCEVVLTVTARWDVELPAVATQEARGQMLSDYFSQNTGALYQYVGGSDRTVPFHQAPSAIVEARDLLETRMEQALKKPIEFNEVLSAAYLQGQKMAFHSDNEPGLGPIVAALSMGTIHFTDKHLLSSPYKGSPALMHFRPVKVTDGCRRKVLLTIVLRHGDILVMDGAGVQEHYQHTVVTQASATLFTLLRKSELDDYRPTRFLDWTTWHSAPECEVARAISEAKTRCGVLSLSGPCPPPRTPVSLTARQSLASGGHGVADLCFLLRISRVAGSMRYEPAMHRESGGFSGGGRVRVLINTSHPPNSSMNRPCLGNTPSPDPTTAPDKRTRVW